MSKDYILGLTRCGHKIISFAQPENIKLIVQHFYIGVRDSFLGIKRALHFLFNSPKGGKANFTAYLKTLALVLCSLIVIPYIYENVLLLFADKMNCTLHLLLIGEGHKTSRRLEFIAKQIFQLGYVIPIHIAIHFITTTRHQELADDSFSFFNSLNITSMFMSSKWSLSFSDTFYDFFFQIVIYFMWIFIAQVPLPYKANSVFGVAFFALIMSYYCFYYKWTKLGWTVDKRIDHMEKNWSYFLGFGFPISLACWWTQASMISTVIYYSFFPLLISSAMIRKSSSDKFKHLSVRFFWLSKVIADWFTGRSLLTLNIAYIFISKITSYPTLTVLLTLTIFISYVTFIKI